MALDLLYSVILSGHSYIHSVLKTLAFLPLIALITYAASTLVKFINYTAPNFIRAVWAILTYTPIILSLTFWIGYTRPRSIQYVINFLLVSWHLDLSLFFFAILATLKGIKIIVQTVSYYLLTNPARPITNPTYTPKEVTVIIPTIGNFDEEFKDCITSILNNNPANIIISTVGAAKHAQALKFCNKYLSKEANLVKVVSINEANKRAQFLHATNDVNTTITTYADDHVFWPSTYLRSSLAPFEDPKVGIVGTAKRVIRSRGGTILESFLNYIACLYLERHNFECTASYNLEGGVFVISGRTAFVRTEIIQSLEYRQAFLRETWFWGRVGPMKVDDDNFTTRWMVNHGLKTVFHNSPDAILGTTLGTTGGFEKFSGQLIRWARTSWRSNSTSLFADCVCWTAYPWTTFAMFISSFFNFALFYDPALCLLLWHSGASHYMCSFLTLLFLSKLIKPLPHLLREPRDIGYSLLGIIFGYFHSGIKFWALVTASNIEWTGREGIIAVGA